MTPDKPEFSRQTYTIVIHPSREITFTDGTTTIRVLEDACKSAIWRLVYLLGTVKGKSHDHRT